MTVALQKYPVLTLPAFADLAKGDVLQLPDGRAAVVPGDFSLGELWQPKIGGQQSVTKAGFPFLLGQEVWFDRSAQQATYRPVNDRDFYLGTCSEEAAAGASRVVVDLNHLPVFKLDLHRRQFEPVIVGTQALGGLGIYQRGGLKLVLDTTNEAQKVDALSVASFAAGTPAIVEIEFAVVNGSAAGAPDCNIGLASATHATDFDSIAQHLAVHLDGNSTTIKVQSKDGTTTVPATTTGVVYTAGATNRVCVTFDLRTPSNVKVYVNGARVLSATPIDVSAAAADWKAIAHVEKTSAADVFEINVERVTVRTLEG